MTFNSVSVGSVPVLLVTNVPGQGSTFIITNGDASNPVYIGSGTKVTVSNGAVIPPYGIVPFQNVISTGPVYAVAGTVATVTVGVFYGDLA